MARPKKSRRISCKSDAAYFKPRGIPLLELEEVHLTMDELEAIRLSDLLGMNYEDAGKTMGVSRATFGRILERARKIVADALINEKALRIEGGTYTMDTEKRKFHCNTCNNKWEVESGTGRPAGCPSCNGNDIVHLIREKHNDL